MKGQCLSDKEPPDKHRLPTLAAAVRGPFSPPQSARALGVAPASATAASPGRVPFASPAPAPCFLVVQIRIHIYTDIDINI